VTLGILPGLGGVVRTVRMLGLANALTQLLVQGQQVRPAQAKEIGIVDEVVASPQEMLAKAREWIAGLEERERARTGISSLRVRFNRVFGYGIEISRPNLPHVPDDYRRTQTLTHAERFVTPYAASGLDEYFAECVRSWVEANDPRSPWPRATRARLRQLDPAMCSILESLFANDLA